MKNENNRRNYRKDTLLTHLGRHPEAHHGAVNPPVYHASTILSANMAEWEATRDPSKRFDIVRYGLLGTPTTFALEEAVAAIEGGYRAMLMSSGLAAITAPLQACLKCGDHVLMVDSCYGPARNFCEKVLTRCGVATTYYDPLIGEDIARLMRPNTRVVYVESPGSLTFEVQDVPAIAAAAHEAGAKVLMDNTWASPYLFRSFEHGVDVSIHAATKYIVGHSDVDARGGHHQRGDVSAGAHDGRRSRPLRGPRRRLFRTARAAHIVGAAGTAREERARGRSLAADPARSLARALPGFARRSRATRCGSAIFSAPADCSAWCSSRRPRPRSMR